MMRLVAAALAFLVAGLPLTMLPSPALAVGSVASLALSLAGVALGARPVVAAGVSLAWLAYAVALAWTGTGLDLASALAMGTVSFLLLETVDFAGRFHAVPLPRRVIVAQARWWLVFSLAVASLVTVVASLAIAVTQPLAPPVAVALALAATALVVVSVLRLVRDRAEGA
jgi:hypothetical protein